ncbi:MAG: outer membrane beta-barrel protein [Hyphomicrobiaceae bacterium]
MTSSKKFIKGAVVAIAAIAGSTSAALAGGEVLYGQGLRGAGVAVPVPAPAPVPDIATGWYLRADLAYSQGDTDKYTSTDPYVGTVRADSYLNNFPRYGFGVGYYYNKWLRFDATLDQRNNAISRGTGTVNYTIPNAAGPNPTIAMRNTYSDNFTSSNSTGLLNGYLDLPVHSRFTPYVGAGIGFVRHQLKGRNFSRTATCVDVDCDPAQVGNQAASTVNSFATATAGGVEYALATALMAGFSFKMWDYTKIDLGYRWLHLAGTTYQGRNTNIVETLKFPDQNIHELRAGVRFDIN